MRDTELWELLANDDGGRTADGAAERAATSTAEVVADGAFAARLAALLEELSQLPAEQRWPFFGRLKDAVTHPAPAVRAAAVRCLAGASGYPGVRWIVRALDDEDEAPRAAAVAALSASSASDAARWAHAAFHARPDVRRAAVAHPPGRRLPWFALLLLPDKGCRAAVLAEDAGAPGAVPPGNVFALFDLVRRGLLGRDRAVASVAEMPVPALCGVLARVGPLRNDEDVHTLLAACRDDRASAAREALKTHPAPDALDDLIDLVWDGAAAADRAVSDTRTPRERFFEKLAGWLLTPKAAQPSFGVRLLAALARHAARRGRWDPLAAELALLAEPDFLRFKWVPPETRTASARAFYRYASRLEPLGDAEVEGLLRLPLCRRPDGHLDLWLVGAILRRAAAHPYQLAERVLGLGEITTSFLAEPAGSAPMFSLGKDPNGRRKLLAAIAGRGRHTAGSILAGLALVSNADELEFLETLDARGALAVYESLLELTRRPGASLSDNKLRRLSDVLAVKLEPEELGNFLHVSLDAPSPEADPLVLRMLSTVVRLGTPQKIAQAVRKLDAHRLKRLLATVANCAGFPYTVEARLAHDLAKHKDPAVRDWAATRAALSAGGSAAPPPTNVPVTPLDAAARKTIATCATVDLAGAVQPCLRGPTSGLCEALSRRTPPGMLSIATCTALLGAHDPPDDVAAQFAVFSADEADFLKKLDAAVVKQWSWNKHLPLLGNCWLHLWDPHCFAAGDALLAWAGGLAGALQWARRLTSLVLSRQVFETVARLLELWRFRDKPKLASLDLAALGEVLLDALGADMALPAAKALVSIYESKAAAELADTWQPKVVALLPALPQPVRAVLQPWVDSTGLAAAAARRAATAADPDVLRRIARCRDLDRLTDFCRGLSQQEVQEATLRLVELGGVGVNRLVDLLVASPPPPLADVIAESLPLWPGGDAVTRVANFFISTGGSSELLLSTGAGLLERDDVDRAIVLPALLNVCRRPVETAWFRDAHWDRLLRIGIAEKELAIELATSPHPHAYRRALELLLQRGDTDLRHLQAVADFLHCGTGRMKSLRLRAAIWLDYRGDRTGFPLLLREAAGKAGDSDAASKAGRLLALAPPALVAQTVRAVLAAGPQLADERKLLELLDDATVDDNARDQAYAALLKDTISDSTRAHVVPLMRAGTSRDTKLRRLARTFAWGVVTGRELTGRIFSVEMNAGQGLGYTRFETDKVWISPLPILRGQRHAEAVTRGLIVHEFGHHLYHRSEGALKVWKEADDAGYHRLLNLVSDEHLERNLRALDDRFGDDLKKLGAFAFQHSDKEVPLDSLLEALQARAFDVLTCSNLAVARKRGCVGVNNGRLLAEMEKAGMSFPRFVRALRMGLGLRGDEDEKVAAGLALFKGARFRGSTMEQLRDVTLKLRDIFGWEAVLMEAFAQDAILTPGAGEVMADAEGITADELREAVRRLLEDRKRGRKEGGKGPATKAMNVGPDEDFQPITTVVPVPFNPEKHAQFAKVVASPARQMRRYLARLGVRMEPQRYRVQGKRVDKARVVPAGIVRGDPRLLIARTLRVEANLFLGLLVDCSGSMGMGDHLKKAQLFGTLLAEAAKGLPGIDVRVFGFTDSVIYDAGDARRCAAHSLEDGGGNNDAAALWHGAQAAKHSRRKAKLLVMISDGAPTECTTAALKALVSRLSARMGMCCAQVAVCPLEVKCFPHYIELPEGQDLGESVRRFGAIITRLVQKAIRG